MPVTAQLNRRRKEASWRTALERSNIESEKTRWNGKDHKDRPSQNGQAKNCEICNGCLSSTHCWFKSSECTTTTTSQCCNRKKKVFNFKTADQCSEANRAYDKGRERERKTRAISNSGTCCTAAAAAVALLTDIAFLYAEEEEQCPAAISKARSTVDCGPKSNQASERARDSMALHLS